MNSLNNSFDYYTETKTRQMCRDIVSSVAKQQFSAGLRLSFFTSNNVKKLSSCTSKAEIFNSFKKCKNPLHSAYLTE